MSPTSESSKRSVRKDHLSKDNKFVLNDDNMSEENSDECMSLESIVINNSGIHKYQNSNVESVEEASTPNFITKRSSFSNTAYKESGKVESSIFYKNNNFVPYDYSPPLISGFDEGNNHYDGEDYSESVLDSDQMYSSNREDVEELKSNLVFPGTSLK